MPDSPAKATDESHSGSQRCKNHLLFPVLNAGGIYAALQVPISVFPETNFPRVVIGVDNGVMPVEQMQVTITKPIEDAINSVPGLLTVRSTTSRGSAEISLFFDWNVDMFHTLQLPTLRSRRSPVAARHGGITTNRLTFATFPILGYALTAENRGTDTVSQTRLWEIATYDLKPPLNRVRGSARLPCRAARCLSSTSFPTLPGCRAPGLPCSISSMESRTQTSSTRPASTRPTISLSSASIGAQAHSAADLCNLVVKTSACGGARPGR